jgi:ATP-dependent helicase/nuclease subunit A
MNTTNPPENLWKQALKNQRQAADPKTSAWVSASAGTGKTKVLTDRVLRLLLSGTKISGVLCLTYTKAAASEMVNRLLERMLSWSVRPLELLRQDLELLIGTSPSQADIVRARQLFFQVIDDPIGLQASTIHSFCQNLLERFPLEAQIAPGFRIIEGAEASTIVNQAIEDALNIIRQQDDDSSMAALRLISKQYSWKTFFDLIVHLHQNQRFMEAAISRYGSITAIIASLYEHHQFNPKKTDAELLAEFIHQTRDRLEKALVTFPKTNGTSFESKTLESLHDWLTYIDSDNQLWEKYSTIFLTQKRKPRAQFAKGNLSTDEYVLFQQETKFCLNFNAQQNHHRSIRLTGAMLEIYRYFDQHYRLRKQQLMALDYHDLVHHVRHFLLSPNAISWVLYKLDNQISHVLIDEAQDSNRDLWEMMETIVGEFFSGQGQRPDQRTIFAVGDVKQSIYGFQQAEPQEFTQANQRFQDYTIRSGQTWHSVDLHISFRSTPAILQAVDAVFNQQDSLLKQGGFTIQHQAQRLGQGGTVELWPVIKASGIPAEQAYADILAKRIKQMLSGEVLASKGRPIEARDIMILLARRKPLIDPILKALQSYQIPAAGLDRLKLQEHLAIQDLIALGKFCLLPSDDFNLAVILKGPLARLSEDQLFDLCYHRPASLWEQVQQHARQHTAYQPIVELLYQLMRGQDRHPFQFYSYVLEQLGFKSKLVDDHGIETLDIIDEFMALSLNFAEQKPGTLQEFIDHIETGQIEIKRDLEQPILNQVRLMTIHGSKGLQAPIVFLPCSGFENNSQTKIIWDHPSSTHILPMLLAGKDYDSVQQQKLRATLEQKQRQEQERLLYVAMTRAEDRLYIAGLPAKPSTDWCYNFIWHGLKQVAQPFSMTTIDTLWNHNDIGLRLETPQITPIPHATAPLLHPSPLPDWWQKKIVEKNLSVATILPSHEESGNLISPLLVEEQQSLYQRGQLIHQLLQLTSEHGDTAFQPMALAFLQQPALGLSNMRQQEILSHINNLVHSTLWQELQLADNLYEIPIQGWVATNQNQKIHISGRIDRLAIFPRDIWIIDYKTHHQPPGDAKSVPVAYYRQMAFYLSLVQQIYPQYQIRCFLLWTAKPLLMELENDLLSTYIYQ